MLLTEFTERTGFNPTPDCYSYCIEPEYHSSSLDKDEWCKQWKRKGGIQKAYDWECNRKEEFRQEYSKSEANLHDAMQQIKVFVDMQQERDDLQKVNAKLTNDKLNLVIFLIEQAEKWSASDLREKAIEIVGAKKYLSYKITHNMNLWDADKELLIENLK